MSADAKALFSCDAMTGFGRRGLMFSCLQSSSGQGNLSV